MKPIWSVGNSINGVPACANKRLLTDLLRNEWGFPGYVISDEGAIEGIEAGHFYTKNATETAAVAVAAGRGIPTRASSRIRQCNSMVTLGNERSVWVQLKVI